ncbi:MAG: tetratricopeptide repeat protein [Desulfofustis sp.]
MAKHEVFDKEWVDERDKNNLEGLLEQLNLPPAVIKFVRENKRLVQIAIAALVLIVVSWSLYGAYRDNRIQKSSEALASALGQEGQQKLDQLAGVAEEFDGTDAALWARINRAQMLLDNSNMSEAHAEFLSIRQDLGKTSLLYPLVTVGLAESAEAAGNYAEAADEYAALNDIEGYESIGYLGAARVYEMQGNSDKALELYGQRQPRRPRSDHGVSA